MRIFLAGASGAIGLRLVPLLLGAGHEVAGTTRSPRKAATLRELGAEPLVVDVYDADALAAAVTEFGAELVMHQLTDLPDHASEVAASRAANARIRVEGTDNLLAAARAAGAERFLAQSIAWEIPGEGARAIDHLERSVLEFGGGVLRYGQFHGQGTYYEAEPPQQPRIQIDAAAERTAELLEAPSGVVTIVDPD
ncbi:MAG TPA: NAD-dependent epimerase/dehydratase family protein [Solirubrobacterales bacterium]|nr:NAD-dependent epimerase/dehydratase family protein [Solirubrobacterales bacterium]